LINPAFTSQTCSLCGQFGVRKGDKFYCENHKVADADYNASINILNRFFDKEITLFTPYKKVKKILLKRLADSTKKVVLGQPRLEKQLLSIRERIT